ncbi:peptidylprolyl isomerase [Pinibacter aurantiacus]|uniref:SurA N-terminal domain-containing protein n=1 Tax=Pinibacter aurantiacus TaxID=2851599 RepID=A0A9E2W1L0_9BACT|nr:peptidylprolyl isomerase [Pinibacter aurantiacus]MBV4356205.1 SurA N-terminal domain-containing protein [Pinibacter aurantiacus]
MSIIQSIRDKAAWLVFGVIALSLLGFLLMDAFVGRGGRGMFSGNKTTIGSINGNDVEYMDFQKKVKATEDQYQSQGYPMNEQMRQNIQEQVWSQSIDETLLDDEIDKAGVTVTPKELDDILFGANPPQDFRRQFTNEKGEYDVNAARQAIAELRKHKNDPRAQSFEDEYLPALLQNRLREKYASLIGNTTYYPKWLLEKTNTDNSQLASISYVATPYSSISDSAVKVSDDDIKSYVSKHSEEFKQEANKSISYVAFSAAPTSNDSAALFTQISNLKNEFASTNDASGFLVRNGSATNYVDLYVVKSKMQMPNADTIRSLSDGAVYGPYLDGGSYALAKMIGKRNLPDSVKCRHILISTQTTPDSIAKVRIDSIAAAIKGGANFADLCAKYSDDPGSKEKGGEYDFNSIQFSNLAKEFAETIFYGNTGDKKVVKTSFGYHYIEVLNQKDFEIAYKVAYLSKPISASTETDNAASGLANQFAGESTNAKAFDANADKRKYMKFNATEIKPMDGSIQGLGSNRNLIKWINEAKVGDVSDAFDVDDKYVVVLVTEDNKEGIASAAKARPQVEFIIRNQKKAEQIKAKLAGKTSSLETAAAAVGQQVYNADSIRFASPFIPNVGQEQKVIGASFNQSLKGKVSDAIAGNGGVFVIKVNNVSAESTGINIDQQRQALIQRAKSESAYRSIQVLRKAATIKDNRAKFF